MDKNKGLIFCWSSSDPICGDGDGRAADAGHGGTSPAGQTERRGRLAFKATSPWSPGRAQHTPAE